MFWEEVIQQQKSMKNELIGLGKEMKEYNGI